MVASSAPPVLAVGADTPSPGQVDTPGTNASILAYLESGERIRQVMDLAFKACVAVLVLVALAWALGVLPGAVKLF